MTDLIRSPRLRRGLSAVTAAVATAALTITLAPTGANAHEDRDWKGAGSSAKSRTVDVMTRNLYLGADLMPVIFALASDPTKPGADPLAVPKAARATWEAVQATKPEERMAAIAEEIAEERPAVVGLQEVTTWSTYAYNPQTGSTVGDPTVVYDFLELLLDALADEGIRYKEVRGATAHNFASPPIPFLATADAPYPTQAVQLADRDVIIKRAGVKTRNARNGTYENVISFPLPGGALPVARGWGSVDVHRKTMKFRFVNSHLEAFGIPGVDAEQLRVAQVGELLAAQRRIAKRSPKMPVVYVGDYNSDANKNAPAYTALVEGVGGDAWLLADEDGPGNTCCFDALLRDPSPGQLDSRIDLILVDDDIRVRDAEVLGEEPEDMTASGLWPSDHAGLVAKLVIDHPSSWGRPGHRVHHRHLAGAR